MAGWVFVATLAGGAGVVQLDGPRQAEPYEIRAARRVAVAHKPAPVRVPEARPAPRDLPVIDYWGAPTGFPRDVAPASVAAISEGLRPLRKLAVYDAPGGRPRAFLPKSISGLTVTVPIVERQPGWAGVLLPSLNRRVGWIPEKPAGRDRKAQPPREPASDRRQDARPSDGQSSGRGGGAEPLEEQSSGRGGVGMLGERSSRRGGGVGLLGEQSSGRGWEARSLGYRFGREWGARSSGEGASGRGWEVRRLSDQLILHRREHRLVWLRDGKRQGSWVVAVGARRTPTPLGRTFVLGRTITVGGVYAGLDALVLGAVPDDRAALAPALRGGHTGIHAWSRRSAFGHSVSNGCVRLPAGAQRTLLRHLGSGTPVHVVD
ncbi:L,D-transpeptidase catalytic domain [Paractinoplanes atraurantiacus]|uniref:L,D-transpeptidase catalytic domain n=1 Tax=Paractinoplanes atraurantiacus TaxID=1036182 RepID=A0A285IRW1_9ACTN|nr:L,D-transpeptidase catalytic domain [Actinoplanes atraurantiacus]